VPAKYEYTHSGNVKNKPYQWKLNDEADTESVIVPGAVANTSYCMTGQTETADDAKMPAVHKIYKKKVEDEVYTEKGAVPGTVTYNDPQNYDMPSQMGAKDVAWRPAMPTADLEKGEPNVRENPYSIDAPGAVANNEDEQTNRPTAWQIRWRPRGSP
jgi:hypothetical protein